MLNVPVSEPTSIAIHSTMIERILIIIKMQGGHQIEVIQDFNGKILSTTPRQTFEMRDVIITRQKYDTIP